MHRAVINVVSLGFLLVTCVAPQAAVLGTFSFSEEYTLPVGIGVEPSDALAVHFSYSHGVGGFEDETTMVFDSVLLVESDDLRVISLGSALDDPQFLNFLARAMNGDDDDIRANAIGNQGGGGGVINFESSALQLAAPLVGPDFNGATISSLELFIASIEFHPNATLGGLNWAVSGELRFIGEFPTAVPLPAGIVLLVSGLPLLIRRVRSNAASPQEACHPRRAHGRVT